MIDIVNTYNLELLVYLLSIGSLKAIVAKPCGLFIFKPQKAHLESKSFWMMANYEISVWRYSFLSVKIGEQIQKNSFKCRPVDSWISTASRKTRKAITPPGCSLIEETEGRSGVTVVIAASFGSQTQIDVRLRSPRDKWALTILLGRHTPSPSVHWSAAGPFTRPLALRTGGFTGDKAATLWVEEWGRLVISKDKPLAFSPFFTIPGLFPLKFSDYINRAHHWPGWPTWIHFRWTMLSFIRFCRMA